MATLEGQRTKPMIDGLYTRHPQYRTPREPAELAEIRRVQGERVRSKRRARQNAKEIMTARLI